MAGAVFLEPGVSWSSSWEAGVQGDPGGGHPGWRVGTKAFVLQWELEQEKGELFSAD